MAQGVSPPDPGLPEIRGIPRAGEIIAGKYVIEQVIGIGGMGAVMAARHRQLGQRVAIKFLLPEAAAQKDSVSRFIREARAASSITSDHVAKVIDVGELESGSPYMVMEFLVGMDLSQLLRQQGPRPVVEVADHVIQACDAIAQAHVLGIVHRDLKPSNLFLAQRGDGHPVIKVLDFGISKMISGGPAEPALTATSFSFGTPVYMSPEQIRSTKNVDPRTDIWALGIIMHELLAGRAPFDAEALTALCAMITVDEPKPLREHVPSAPEPLERIILRCLQKDVRARYQSVGELASALAPFASESVRWMVPRIDRLLQSGGYKLSAAIPLPTPSSDTRERTTNTWEGAQASLRNGRLLWGLGAAGAVLLATIAGLAVMLAREEPAPIRPALASSAQPGLSAAPEPPASASAAPPPSSDPPVASQVKTPKPPGAKGTIRKGRGDDALGDRH